ncbi:MAG: hypothetical protein HW416_486 [Chloroflexi bacterium]|nr:hypothetical protein [Chloroflexota bacterium]
MGKWGLLLAVALFAGWLGVFALLAPRLQGVLEEGLSWLSQFDEPARGCAPLGPSSASLASHSRIGGPAPLPSRAVQFFLVPLGDFPTESLDVFASYYRARWDLDIKVLPTEDLDEDAWNPQRSQFTAEQLVRQLDRVRVAIGERDDAVIFGLLNDDIYIASRTDWRFAFSYRDGYSGVLSACRMNPESLGERTDPELAWLRMRKMLTKQVALYHGVPASDNPKSAVFRNILGVDDLDRMTEEI